MSSEAAPPVATPPGDSDAERLYDRLGWTRFGQVPGYAMRADGGARELCTFFYKEL